MLLDDGTCPGCAAEALREQEREAQRRAREDDRRRLGLRPEAKARHLVLLSLDATAHWLSWLRRYVQADDVDAVERAVELVATARAELDQ